MAEVRRRLIVDFQTAQAYALALECRRLKAGSGFIHEAPRDSRPGLRLCRPSGFLQCRRAKARLLMEKWRRGRWPEGQLYPCCASPR
jgi:hypothetical protein